MSAAHRVGERAVVLPADTGLDGSLNIPRDNHAGAVTLQNQLTYLLPRAVVWCLALFVAKLCYDFVKPYSRAYRHYIEGKNAGYRFEYRDLSPHGAGRAARAHRIADVRSAGRAFVFGHGVPHDVEAVGDSAFLLPNEARWPTEHGA